LSEDVGDMIRCYYVSGSLVIVLVRGWLVSSPVLAYLRVRKPLRDRAMNSLGVPINVRIRYYTIHCKGNWAQDSRRILS